MNPGSSPLGAAFARALYSAIILGLAAGVAVLTQGGSDRDAVLAAAGAALGVLSLRGLGEGVYDQARDAAGKVSASDVKPAGITPLDFKRVGEKRAGISVHNRVA